MRKHIVMAIVGSAEHVPPVLNEGSSFAQAGYDVTLLAIRTKKTQSREESPVGGFNIKRMTLLTRSIFGEGDRWSLLRYCEIAVRSFFLALFQRADLFIAHDLVTLPYLYPLARLRGKPIVYRAHEIWSEQSVSFPHAPLWHKFDRFFSQRVDLIVSPEQNRARIYQEEYKAPKFPTVVFNCPKFIEKPDHSPLRQILSDAGITCRHIVYYQGGCGPTRSTDILVQSMQFLSEDVALVLIGTAGTAFIEWLRSFTKFYNMERRILYLDPIPYGARLFELCSGADVGAAFAKGDCRNNLFSATATNKLFEYMMMGLPVVAPNFKSYQEIVEKEEIGICVDSENPSSIADGVTKLLHDPNRLFHIKANCLRFAKEKYNWDLIFPKLLKRYQELMR